MLMQWAKDDPVSEKETNRNNAVYGIQQNRNPFIDYPGLEDYIWGDKKGVTFSYDDYDRDPTLGMIELNATFGTTESRVIYDLNGHRIAKAQKGVNILRKLMGDGTVVIEKVLVK